MGTRPNGPIRELRWWQIPSWLPRWQVGLAGALVGGLSVGVGVCLAFLVPRALLYDEPNFSNDLLKGLEIGLFAAFIVGVLSVLGVKAVSPRSMAIRWPKLRDLRSVGTMVLRIGPFFVLGFGVLAGVLTGVEDGLTEGLIAGVVLGLLFGLISGVVFGVPLGLVDVWRVPLAAMLAATPRVVYQRDVRSHRVSGLMGGLTGGIVGAILGVRGDPGFQDVLFYGLAFGLTLGLTLGVVSGLVSGFRAGAAPSLLFTELALLARGRRVRFMPLHETALARQILRQAGAVYQFRHADLQDRLAERYEAGITSDLAS
jgi:hypothetical protein